MEGALSKGEAVSLDGFVRATSHLRRLHESLGIERKAIDVTTDVQAYLAHQAAQRAADADPIEDEAA